MNSLKTSGREKNLCTMQRMQWDQNTQFSEQQEEEDKREEFWTELHYGRGGRTALYGIKAGS